MGRPVVAPKFAEQMKLARSRRVLTMGQVVARIHQGGPAYEGFTRAQLARYEDGTIAAPDPVVLLKLARLYDITLERMVEWLLADREARALATESPPGDARSVKGRRTGSR